MSGFALFSNGIIFLEGNKGVTDRTGLHANAEYKLYRA